jgi:hypothetical protein
MSFLVILYVAYTMSYPDELLEQDYVAVSVASIISLELNDVESIYAIAIIIVI